MNKIVFLLVLFLMVWFSSRAQVNRHSAGKDTLSEKVELRPSVQLTDSLTRDSVSKDSVKTVAVDSALITPKRTALYSAIVPGLGQIFNHQYWKLPIIYGGLAVAIYFIRTNSQQYNEFRSIYIGRSGNDPAAFAKHPELTSLSQIQSAMDFYRYNLDLTVALTAVGYGLQIIDALVFANLRGFDISPDISMKTAPVLYPGGIGLGLVVNF